MRWRLKAQLLCLSILCCLFCIGGHATEDRRERVDPNALGNGHLKAIGLLIDRKRKKSATAILISACHILTNRHTVGGVRVGAGGEAEEDLAVNVVGSVMEFEIGFDAFNPLQLQSMTLATVVASGKGGDLDDWAILRLRRLLGTRYGIARLQDLDLSPGTQVATAGYPADRLYWPDDSGRLAPSRWLWQQHGTLQEAHDYWTADLRVMAGQSGSPVFVKRSDGYAVVGLLRGELTAAEAESRDTHNVAQVMPLGTGLLARIAAIIEHDACN